MTLSALGSDSSAQHLGDDTGFGAFVVSVRTKLREGVIVI
jgi:hypothetical protein